MPKMNVKVADIVKQFDLEQVAGNEEALNRKVEIAEMSRPGFELAGFFQHSDFRRIVVFGEKEMAFISQLTKEVQKQRFECLTDAITPCIIICKGYECPEVLKKIADHKNFPILTTTRATGRMSIALSAYLDELLAPSTQMHGVFLNIYGKGVIIKGDSGIGKSEIALELIKRGHILIADDCIELYRLGESVQGRAPEVLYNFLEIRGIGVINVEKMFGISATLEKDVVDFVIQLERWIPSKEYTRIGTEENPLYEDILGVNIPKSVIPVTGGRSMSVVIEAAVMNIRLKDSGYDSSKEFVKRILSNIEHNKSHEE